MGGKDATGKSGGAGGGEFAKQANQWSTPKAFDARNCERKTPNTTDGCRSLANDLAHWQTPAADSFRSRGGDRKDEMKLDQQARNHEAQPTRFWGSPRAAEYKGSGPEGSKSHQHRLDRGYLDAQCESFHPDPELLKNGETFSAITLGSPLPSQRKKLNPLFVSWLMGWPIWWCAKEPTPYGCSAMASFLSNQRRHLSNLLGGSAHE
jgi:DNA (cytosine-5)-methyltransferase 1